MAALENNFKLVWLWSGVPVDPTNLLLEENGHHLIAEVLKCPAAWRPLLGTTLGNWLSYRQGSFLAAKCSDHLHEEFSSAQL